MARVIDLKVEKEETKEPVKAVEQKEVKVATPAPPADEERSSFRTLRWIAPSVYRRSGLWAPYVFAVLLAILAVLAIVVQHNLILTILLALMAIMVVVHVRRPVSTLAVEISPINITIQDRSIPYDQIKSFWIQFEPQYDIRELSLQFKRWYLPYTKIQIADADPVQIRSILVQFIPEVEHEETLVNSLVRRLGL